MRRRTLLGDGTALMPASMKTVAATAAGYGENFIYRAGDATIKKRCSLACSSSSGSAMIVCCRSPVLQPADHRVAYRPLDRENARGTPYAQRT